MDFKWHSDAEAMAKKTAVKRVADRLPPSWWTGRIWFFGRWIVWISVRWPYLHVRRGRRVK